MWPRNPFLQSLSSWLFQISVTPDPFSGLSEKVAGGPSRANYCVIVRTCCTFLICILFNSQDNPLESGYIIASMNIAIVINAPWKYFISHYQKHFSRVGPFLTCAAMCFRPCVGHGWLHHLSSRLDAWRVLRSSGSEYHWLALSFSQEDMPHIRHRLKTPHHCSSVLF